MIQSSTPRADDGETSRPTQPRASPSPPRTAPTSPDPTQDADGKMTVLVTSGVGEKLIGTFQEPTRNPQKPPNVAVRTRHPRATAGAPNMSVAIVSQRRADRSVRRQRRRRAASRA